MSKVLQFLLLFLLFISNQACTSTSAYNVVVDVIDNKADSISLYVYEPDYVKIRLLNVQKINRKGDVVSFTGQIEQPKLGILKISNDTIPYYFILDSEFTDLAVGSNKMLFKDGSVENKGILKLYDEVDRLKCNKAKIADMYSLAIKDSTLTAALESKYLKEFREVNDSLQFILTRAIKSDKLSSYIIARRFGNMINSDSIPAEYKK